jgi:hypothetical protein
MSAIKMDNQVCLAITFLKQNPPLCPDLNRAMYIQKFSLLYTVYDSHKRLTADEKSYIIILLEANILFDCLDQ